jgi:hypothetical protein
MQTSIGRAGRPPPRVVVYRDGVSLNGVASLFSHGAVAPVELLAAAFFEPFSKVGG